MRKESTGEWGEGELDQLYSILFFNLFGEKKTM